MIMLLHTPNIYYLGSKCQTVFEYIKKNQFVLFKQRWHTRLITKTKEFKKMKTEYKTQAYLFILLNLTMMGALMITYLKVEGI